MTTINENKVTTKSNTLVKEDNKMVLLFINTRARDLNMRAHDFNTRAHAFNMRAYDLHANAVSIKTKINALLLNN